MDSAAAAEPQIADGRQAQLRSRAAKARQAALETRRQSEIACDRAAAALTAFDGRPFGDRGGRFLLQIGRSRPLLRLVRHDLRRWLEQTGLSAEAIGEVILACSEACANAVEHPHQAGRQLVEVEARVDDGDLELRVRDFGSWKEQPGSPMRGRGMQMIRDLMDSLDVQRTADGTEVVMRRSVSA